MTTEPNATDERSGGELSPTGRKATENSNAEPTKPPIFWMLVPVVVIVLAIYLAR